MSIISLIAGSLRSLIATRYHVNLTGVEHLSGDAPLLILPNHPALIDPLILTSHLLKHTHISPVITETYATGMIGHLTRELGAVTVGDIARGGSSDDVTRAFDELQKAITSGKNILLYPSGHIYVQGFEHTQGKKMAYTIMEHLPKNTRILLIRTRGLWGSMYSKAYTGKSPLLGKNTLKGIGYILANTIFFVPKRSVSIEIHDMSEKVLNWQKEGLEVFNQKLQDFYNEPGVEECRFIPHFFYHNDINGKKEPEAIEGSIKALERGSKSHVNLSEDLLRDIQDIVSKIKDIPPEHIQLESNLILDLGFDSLDMAEIKSRITNKYPQASNPPISLLITVQDVGAMVLGLLMGEESLPDIHWGETDASEPVKYSYKKGDTIPKLIIKQSHRLSKEVAIYDAVIGEMDRSSFLLRSYVVSEMIKKYHNARIGIMMPALSSTSLLLTGCYLAGKVPVMLNWTVGERSFAHCMQFAELDTILTSRKFFEKIQTPWLKEYESKMIFIEDIIKNLTLTTKIKAIIRKFLHLAPKAPREAVILFTSGSESLPKAVVLTHENILSDIDGALRLVPFQNGSIFLGMLPPFHSFGFTINTICPLILPLRAAYTPDPSDSRTIVQIIAHTGAQVIAGTPTFLRMILKSGTKEALSSIQTLVAGAEKCSDEVFSLVRENTPKAILIEGYGITECSPIVSVNPLSSPRSGSVGKPLPTLGILICDLNSYEPLELTKEGMILVCGKSIFDGYIDLSLKSPFREVDGQSYYETGDLGYLDEDGYLHITGRLKRFVKIAGEMISLPALESVLLEWARETQGDSESIPLAIEAKEINGEVTIVAFSTIGGEKEILNHYLHTHGIPALAKISHVEEVDIIPVLGTGKTDYKALKEKISTLVEAKTKIDAKSYNLNNSSQSLIQKIAELSNIAEEKIKTTSVFGQDIILDSIDVGELSLFIKTHYPKTHIEDIKSIQTVGDLINKIITNE